MVCLLKVSYEILRSKIIKVAFKSKIILTCRFESRAAEPQNIIFERQVQTLYNYRSDTRNVYIF